VETSKVRGPADADVARHGYNGGPGLELNQPTSRLSSARSTLSYRPIRSVLQRRPSRERCPVATRSWGWAGLAGQGMAVE
jgi:hypothetical protein